MKPTEAVKLTRAIKAVCPQQHVDTLTPDTWGSVLADLHFADCLTAVHAIARRQPFISASDVVAEVRRIREQRIDDARIPVPPLELADDGPAELAWRRQVLREIADGVPVDQVSVITNPARLELEAGE
jgi:hypothetical protein